MKQFIRVKNWHGYAAVVLINVNGRANTRAGLGLGFEGWWNIVLCLSVSNVESGPQVANGAEIREFFGLFPMGGCGGVLHGLGKQTKKHKWA